MFYYLKHHFDPYFDPEHIRPREDKTGRVDYYNMGYVQNVVAGQVLAEWVEIGENEAQGYDRCFVFKEKEFIPGPNTIINPQDPDQLIAASNGYVFYNQGHISVKKFLNVRRDVDFHTGNIYFVGDMMVHGRIRTGFEVQAVNIRVNKVVEGAKLKAQKSIIVDGGIKGAGQAIIEAGENFRSIFCEKAKVRACEKLLVDGVSMHSDLLSRNMIVVKGRMIGGRIFSSRLVFVKEQLGGGMGNKTVLTLGYDSKKLHDLEMLASGLSELTPRVVFLENKISKGDAYAEKYISELEKKRKKMEIFKKKYNTLKADVDDNVNLKAKVVVPGEVRPGVVIKIGPAELSIDDYLRDVCFFYDNGEIKYRSPAMDGN